MRFYDIIEKKKAGMAIPATDIYLAINDYLCGNIPDYQMSAFLMAVCFRGMNDEETLALTRAILDSGSTVDLGEFGDATVDKHSSGGVGDKTTLIITPIVAAVGAVVPKMSGRGLGHTGGTVDKLESIPGYRTSLSPEEFKEQVREVGIAVVGQNTALAPADGKLYALRDVTATVDSIPLIASSIMGKKLAGGARSIVLDVKYGCGAFMKTEAEAELLAEKMIAIGKGAGRRMAAVISPMNEPLGFAVGNAIEVEEAAQVLRGEGETGLTALCVTLSSLMISLALGVSVEEGEALAKEALYSKAALTKFKEWLGAQGADVTFADGAVSLPLGKYTVDIKSDSDGYLCAADAMRVGLCAMTLGAGRETKEDKIDFGAGVRLMKKVGDKVRRGDVLARLYTSDESKLCAAADGLVGAFTISDKAQKDIEAHKIII